MITCKRCNLEKNDSEFKQKHYNSRGYKPICFSCSKPLGRKKSSKEKDIGDIKQKSRTRWLRFKYGITIEEYNSLHAMQNGKCGICHSNLVSPHIDHCHTTNKIRGLLCAECNKGLGMFRDNIDHLQAAIEYIKQHQR